MNADRLKSLKVAAKVLEIFADVKNISITLDACIQEVETSHQDEVKDINKRLEAAQPHEVIQLKKELKTITTVYYDQMKDFNLAQHDDTDREKHAAVIQYVNRHARHGLIYDKHIIITSQKTEKNQFETKTKSRSKTKKEPGL